MQETDEATLEQARETEEYRQWLVDAFKEMSEHSINLRNSYIRNEEDRDSHFKMISIAIELWIQLFPKIQGSRYEQQFKQWLPFVMEPRMFLIPKYEQLIWLMESHIRMGFEHLGLTRI